MIKRIVKAVFPLLVSGSLMWLIFSKWPVHELLDTMADAEPVWVLVGLWLGFSERFVASQRTRHLLIRLSLRIGRWTIYRIALIMNYAGFLLPGILAGAPMRIALIARHTRDLSHTAAVVILDRVIDMWMLFIVGGLSGLYVAHSAALAPGLLLSLLAISTSAVIYISRRWMAMGDYTALETAEMENGFFRRRMKKLTAAFRNAARLRNKDLRIVAFWSLLGHALGVLQYWAFCAALSLDVAILDIVWMRAAVVSLMLIPISFAGIGVRDLTLIGSLTFLGYSEASALGLSWLILSALIVQALAGAVCVFYPSVKTSSENIIESGR